jgi:hypothetical protein
MTFGGALAREDHFDLLRDDQPGSEGLLTAATGPQPLRLDQGQSAPLLPTPEVKHAPPTTRIRRALLS